MTGYLQGKRVVRRDLRTLGRRERAVYNLFRDAYFPSAEFWRVGFPILGEGVSLMLTRGRGWRSYGLVRRRIDLVYKDKAGVHVVEFKVTVGPAAIGQVLLYRDYIERTFPETRPVQCRLAGFSVESDILGLCRRLGIVVDLFSS